MPIYFVAHDRDKLLRFGSKGEHFFEYEEELALKGVLRYLPKPIQTLIQYHNYNTNHKLRRSLATRLAFALEQVHEETKTVRIVAQGVGTVLLLHTLLSGMVKVLRPDLKFKLHLLDSPLNKGVLLNTLPNSTLKKNNVKSVVSSDAAKGFIDRSEFHMNREYRMLLSSTEYSAYGRPSKYKSITEYIKYVKENYGH